MDSISISEEDKLEIKRLAEGLTEDEVCLYMYGVELDQLADDAKADFRREFTRGRTNFKIHAINALKAQMHGRQGLQASLSALTRFGDAWPKISEEAGNGEFNFKIVLGDDLKQD